MRERVWRLVGIEDWLVGWKVYGAAGSRALVPERLAEELGVAKRRRYIEARTSLGVGRLADGDQRE